MILIFITTNFEEIEVTLTVDVLRRAGLHVDIVSLIDTKQVKGGHNISITADLLFNEVNFETADLLILPGGTATINEHEGLKNAVRAFAECNKPLAAICAAPMVFGGLGLLKNKQATCYPGYEKYLTGAILKTTEAVVVDGNITTAKGPGLTFDFALQIVESMLGLSKRNEVASGLLLPLK